VRGFACAVAGAVLVSCAAATQRPAQLHRLDALLASPMAREAQRAAPEAYAEFAGTVLAAERSASGPAWRFEAYATDAEITLAWAATQTRLASARTRIADAERRRRAAEDDRQRLELAVARMQEELRESALGRERAERVHAAVARPTAVPPEQRANTAALVREQTRWTLAVATLDPNASARVQAARAMLETAGRDARGTDAMRALASAVRAWRTAEALVGGSPSSHEP